MAGGRESTAAEIFVGNRVELAVTLQRPEHYSPAKPFVPHVLVADSGGKRSIHLGWRRRTETRHSASQPASQRRRCRCATALLLARCREEAMLSFSREACSRSLCPKETRIRVAMELSMTSCSGGKAIFVLLPEMKVSQVDG